MIIFYDANCPLRNTEMQHLKDADTKHKIVLEDLNSCDFSARYPSVNKNKAMAILHAQLPSGEMIYGLDVTYQAWKTVGKYRWLKIFRLPIIRYFADVAYLFFAKHRQKISQLLMPSAQCSSGQCTLKPRDKQ
ncbi:thiol-disulfide oxidoreductase DCC family protein [Pseudoalteromonas sp. C12FD-1]|uniref:thiol-disulfide oxidoreductase DCC family protein n=1 Tax=Pseudoalteromonas sp. C12FD-1 TaxID=3131979 RepID=UPI00307E7305